MTQHTHMLNCCDITKSEQLQKFTHNCNYHSVKYKTLQVPSGSLILPQPIR